MCKVKVIVKDHGEFVSGQFPNGDTHTLSWSDLVRFEVQTNDSGPYGSDVWFVLVGSKDTLSFPLGATGEEEVLERLQAVTGKDRSQLIDGMNCSENCSFVTWEKATSIGSMNKRR